MNSRGAVLLPVRMLDRAGRLHRVSGLRYQWLSGVPVRVTPNGEATCDRQGDAEVRVSRGEMSTRFVLMCLPIIGFHFSLGARLVVGGPPQDLPFTAIGMDSQPVRIIAGTATVRNSDVAYLDGLRVHPKGVGTTMVDIDIGDCTTSIMIEVDEPAATPSNLSPGQVFAVTPVSLVGGEMRSWRITPGPYELWLRPRNETPRELVLAAFATNCARWPGPGQRYNCIALEGASVVVRHPRKAGEGAELAGDLTVRRLEDVTRPNFSRASQIGPDPYPEKESCPLVR